MARRPHPREFPGDAAEGSTIVANFDRDDPRPAVQSFLREVRARCKHQPYRVGAPAGKTG